MILFQRLEGRRGGSRPFGRRETSGVRPGGRGFKERRSRPGRFRRLSLRPAGRRQTSRPDSHFWERGRVHRKSRGRSLRAGIGRYAVGTGRGYARRLFFKSGAYDARIRESRPRENGTSSSSAIPRPTCSSRPAISLPGTCRALPFFISAPSASSPSLPGPPHSG